MNKLTYISAIAAGLASLSACGDQVTNITEKSDVLVVAKFKNLEKCEDDMVGTLAYVSDSAKSYVCTEDGWVTFSGADGEVGPKGEDGDDGKNGTSCTLKELKSKDGYKIICGDDSVGVVLNGEKGEKGEPGDKGDPGDNGSDGSGCTLADNQSGIVTVTCGTTTTTLYKALCGTVPYEPTKKTCSNGMLLDINPTTPTPTSICGMTIYNTSTHQCVNGTITPLPTTPSIAYCGTLTYLPSVQQCLNGTIVYINNTTPTLPGSSCESTDLWCEDTYDRVQTGFTESNEHAGYWWSYDDGGDGGASSIAWPAELDEYMTMAPIFETCNGLCGTVSLGQGTLTRTPFAGVGFDVAGKNESDAPIPADISDWNGICITYTSTMAAHLYLRLAESQEEALGYDVPNVSLPRTSSALEKCFLWSDFSQAGWGKAGKITGTEAATQTTNIRFEIQGVDGTSGEFNIIRLRKNDEGEHDVTIPCGDMWCGPDGMTSVVTGIGTSKANYWWFKTDNNEEEEGNSYFEWPVDIGNEYSDEALDPVIKQTGALSGSISLGDAYEYPYAEFGFNMDDDTEDEYDITEWEGFCVVYTSSAPFKLVLVPGDEEEYTNYDNLKASIGKTNDIKTVNLQWSAFAQSGWGNTVDKDEALTKVKAISFRFDGKAGESPNFKIYSIGKLGTCGTP